MLVAVDGAQRIIGADRTSRTSRTSRTPATDNIKGNRRIFSIKQFVTAACLASIGSVAARKIDPAVRYFGGKPR